MSELDRIIRTRRSVRKFKDKKVARTILMKVLGAGLWAPSGCNRQLWNFIVIDSDELKTKLVKSGCSKTLKNAPVIVFVLYSKKFNARTNDAMQSAAAAIQNILLKAHEIGLGGCWCNGYGSEKAVRKVLRIPKSQMIVSAILFGWPDDTPPAPPRRKGVIHFNSFERFVDYPESYMPNAWSMNQIRDYLSFVIRAKSPQQYHYNIPRIAKEFESEIGSIPKLPGKTLDLFPLFGNHDINLLESNKVSELTIYNLSEEASWFINERLLGRGIKRKIKYIHNLPGKPEFDNLLCIKVINRVPHPKKFLQRSLQALKIGGHIYITFRNALSYQLIGTLLLWSRKNPPSAFAKPRNVSAAWNVIKYLQGCKIDWIKGVGLLPLKYFDSFSTYGPLKYFCSTIMIKATKVK